MINAERIPRDIIVIGASAGGVEALTQLFGELPEDLPAVIATVLHRHPLYNLNLPRVLGRQTVMRMKEPASHEPILRGTIYLAPCDQHMVFGHDCLNLNRGPKEHFTRPAVDPLFDSAAAVYGRRVIGVLLTGSGNDGVSGLIRVKAHGGIAIVQDPKEAKVPLMPTAALRQDHVDLVVPLAGLASVLVQLAKGDAVNPIPAPAA